MEKIPEHFPFIILDEFIVMPNHIHGILFISKDETRDVEAQYFASLHQPPPYKNKFGPQSGNISSVMRGYKAAVKSYATTNGIEFAWQARFHDRIIRDEGALEQIRKYIRENPANWIRDMNNNEGLYM